MHKYIYYFGKTLSEGDAGMTEILGGKGAHLAQMCKIGLPVPPGFTISSKISSMHIGNENHLTHGVLEELEQNIKKLEKETGKTFGSGKNPLLLSVRSGSKVSMPGMMDTILNLGINDEVVSSLAKSTSDPRFAYDCYRRFIEMYGSVVLEISHYNFERILEEIKEVSGVASDGELSAEQLQELVKRYKTVIKKYSGHDFETNPFEQLKHAIIAVLKSWMSPRAITYRNIHNISDSLGTAINIQTMVFGNKGNDSATGVVFTRNPATGEKKIFGEYLINAQGEDVVAGIRTPFPILAHEGDDNNSMQSLMNEQYEQLLFICQKLEIHYEDMQDIEFTIEKGKLYILQTRSGKRSTAAAVKIAVDMVEESLISKQEALLRIEPESLHQLLHTAVDYKSKPQVIASGLPASPGASTGIVVFSPYDAEELSRHHKVILVRNDTSPEDIKGMHVSAGIITARGGMTSHAAVVARGMGKPCICGINGLAVNEASKTFRTPAGIIVKEGETITIDGSNGKILVGEIKLINPEFSGEFKTILKWADEEKRIAVRANAETKLDASVAIKFGANGIGLCRTEHMFFESNKIPLVREMIIAQTPEQRASAISRLKPLQTEDFKSLFEVMSGLPVNIRLLDPPLHEFLPKEESDKLALAQDLDVPIALVNHRLHVLHETNPMLGHRGCRLGISFPEIYSMQVEAILEAFQTAKTNNTESIIEIMVPLICDVQEIIKLKELILATISKMEAKYSTKFPIKIGTMIELPRAAILADEIAEHVEYFSFGSNDLTQTTYGISRDDIGSFMPDYIEQGIFAFDPFVHIDIRGVGHLIKMAIEKGKSRNARLTIGICGEHAGDPKSIEFFDNIGVDYVSCSPYRIPIARIAAARSKILLSQGSK
ncbi:MAG: pyruvate, phosphate dikinase [Rickettsiales bacterium]|nr:pyruvate, phosphate dikinase [Rickettsiales bacterium]MCA0254832.1 pyruvate, phosphate dikinase [Pseudomonadota bacterium]